MDMYNQMNQARMPPVPHTQINSKWITDLNVTGKTEKTLREEYIGMYFCNLGFGKAFLDMIPCTQWPKKIRFHQILQLLCFKWYQQGIWGEKTANHIWKQLVSLQMVTAATKLKDAYSL